MAEASGSETLSLTVLPSLLFAAFLFLLGMGLQAWHAQAWHAAQSRGLNERELSFARRQFRRRATSSLLIMIVGALVAGGEWIVAPAASLVYWLCVLLAVLWILALATADAFASRQYFAAEQGRQDAEFSLLSKTLRQHADDPLLNERLPVHRRNGHPPARDSAAE